MGGEFERLRIGQAGVRFFIAVFAFDEEAIAEQARAILEDVPVQVFKVGFVGSPEAISAIAEIASD